jgi:hypothetical protein
MSYPKANHLLLAQTSKDKLIREGNINTNSLRLWLEVVWEVRDEIKYQFE